MEKINVDFKKTCKLLFGREIGELAEFAPYLSEKMFPSKKMRSAVSGKGVFLSSPHYPADARYVSQDEVALLRLPPASINDVKDIDSLFRAAQENAAYCGNKMFGKNLEVADVDNCADCAGVLHSHNITNTKNAAYCSVGRDSESIYSVHFFKGMSHAMCCMQCLVRGAARCFECHCSAGISDSYYTLNCSGCSDCIFCFGLRSRKNCIGNLQLPRERYLGLKAHLVSQMADTLVKERRIFSIADIFPKERGGWEDGGCTEEEIPGFAKNDIATASKIILGKHHIPTPKTAKWLSRRALRMRRMKGRGGSGVYWADLPSLGRIPPSCLVTLDAAVEEGAAKSVSIAEGEMPGLLELGERAGKFAPACLELLEGQVQNCESTMSRFDSVDCCRLWAATRAKHSGFHTAVTESEYIFGGYFRALYSKFCIDCDNVTSVSNCFSCDSCFSCRNCYFCHNCENVEEGILCFNLKGARYAVLNQSVSKEEYMRVKRMLLDYVNGELETKGGLERSIFDLAGGKAQPDAEKRA